MVKLKQLPKFKELHKEVMRSMRSYADYSAYVQLIENSRAMTGMLRNRYLEWEEKKLLKERPCPLCGSSKNLERLFRKKDIPLRAYTKCNSCDLVFESPFVDENTYTELYKSSFEGIEKKARDIKENHRINDALITSYKPLELINMRQKSGKFLDFGCGTGWVMNLAKKRFGYDVYGIDIDENAIARAARLIGEPDKVLNGNNYDEGELNGMFDIVHSNQSLEHILNPGMYIRKFYNWLSPGGLLFLSFPVSDSFVFRFLGERNCMSQVGHISMFSRLSITSLLKRNGFTDISFQHTWVDLSALEFIKKLLGVPFTHRQVYVKSKAAIVSLYFPVSLITIVLHSLEHIGFLKGNYGYVFARKYEGAGHLRH
ncbi:MAG: class I SAM-dependent methyltransferase [Nitrospiraceae bacterium]|nr:class I SAM-dependent methyltransferase [Nitrospiraceae bacterium]